MWGETCDPESLGGEQLLPDPEALSFLLMAGSWLPAHLSARWFSPSLLLSGLQPAPEQLRGTDPPALWGAGGAAGGAAPEC